MGMSFWQDVKYGVRMLARNPGLTVVMAIAMALGIGVNTTVFTLANAVLFRGLPFERADRVMHLTTTDLAKNRSAMHVSYPDFQDWRAQASTFQSLAAFSDVDAVITDSAAPPEHYNGSRMTANAFSLIGQKPFLGRDFLPEEDRPGAPPVCIIGYSVWESRYGRDPNVLGRSVRINEAPATIVGVMPPGMRFPMDDDLWTPLVPAAEHTKREYRNVEVMGRLADGVKLGRAQEEFRLITQRLEKAYPKSNQGIRARIVPYNDQLNVGQVRTVFLVLLGAVGFVLLIACANVANLLLARSLGRSREMSIRAALGAGRWRVIRQLLVESVLVAALGGAGGWLIAMWGVHLFDLATAHTGRPYWIEFRMDFTALAYLAAICVATSVLFGIAPALQLSKVDLSATLTEGGRGASGGARTRYLSAALVVTEVALSIVLLMGAGLMIRSFLNMYGMTNQFHGDRFLVMRLDLPETRYPNDAARGRFSRLGISGRKAASPWAKCCSAT